jgi:hypothetical protein
VYLTGRLFPWLLYNGAVHHTKSKWLMLQPLPGCVSVFPIMCLSHLCPRSVLTASGMLCFLPYFRRRTLGYKGKILAAAQSNVAVDNMLETAMKREFVTVRGTCVCASCATQ